MAGGGEGEPEQKKSKLGDSDRNITDHDVPKEEEDSDSGEEEVYSEDEDGCHDMTAKEFRKYYKQVQASGGFDVDKFPKSIAYGRIEPMGEIDTWFPGCLEDLTSDSQIAINWFNDKHGTSYEFVKILKANVVGVAGFIYYITFEAKNAEGLVQTFQASVFEGIPTKLEDGTDNITVELCRIKPTK